MSKYTLALLLALLPALAQAQSYTSALPVSGAVACYANALGQTTSCANIATPTVPTQTAGDSSTAVASTSFVGTAITNGLLTVNPGTAVTVATTQASDTSGLTYLNGVAGVGATLTGTINTALTVDGVTFNSLTQSLLVKNDTQSPSGAYNGIYNVTQLQTAILPPVLTRRLDYDMASDINNTGPVSVISGTANATTAWLLTTQVTTVGTDPLTFTQFTYAPSTVQSGTWASRPAATANKLYYATDYGPRGCLVAGDGTVFKPASGCCTIYQKASATSLTSSVSEVNLDIATVSGGIMSSTGSIRIFYLASAQGAAGNRTPDIRISSASGTTSLGTVMVNAPMTSAQFSIQQLRDIWAANSITAQIGAQAANTGAGGSTNIPATATVATQNTWYINFNATLASSADAMNYQGRSVQYCD